MKLVIVESPAKAKTIQKYLGAEFEVAASYGHVRDLPAKGGGLAIDVKKGFVPKYVIPDDKEKRVAELQKLVKKAERVYLATDPDREGEAIAWHLAQIFGLPEDGEQRVTFNEITKSGVQAGMQSLRSLDMDLVNAQQGRRLLDRIVGYKLSPFVASKIRRGLSAGRVQSVAVRMIVDREEQIRAFIPQEYWSLDAKLINSGKKIFTAAFAGDETGKVKLISKDQTDGYLARLNDASYTVRSVKKGTRKKSPAPPFTTSTLQQDASAKLGFQSQRTMRIAQELYEGVNVHGQGSMGLITYMRTDSLRISQEALDAAAQFISGEYGAKYLPAKPRVFRSRANAQDGHEAIRPSDPARSPDSVKGSLSPDQLKLYTLIWKRFIASQMAECLQDTIKAEIISANTADSQAGRYVLFSASGYAVKFDGFTKLYALPEGSDEGGKMLPPLSEGESVKCKELLPAQHFTEPPARYTEATLIKALEENGIGRPSTYATVMSTIQKRGYVTRQSKALSPTEAGEVSTRLLKERFPKIVDTKFTAGMETRLDGIALGKETYPEMLRSFYGGFMDTLAKAKEDMKDVKITLEEDKTDIPCELCGRLMIVKHGRFGPFLSCSGYPECTNAKPIKPPTVDTGALCPKCGGKVLQKTSKKGRIFFGCENWAWGGTGCDFVTWNEPLAGEKCPKCGKALFFQKKGALAVCLAEGCGFEEERPELKKQAATARKRS
ncbi:MAG: type I DNA topoisomerase [Oscillospiraceae bacterium]|jgi:DNA topoisomerase-1|nr:type I DNA topoisomerase [Oscillospiraceae bacterium]